MDILAAAARSNREVRWERPVRDGVGLRQLGAAVEVPGAPSGWAWVLEPEGLQVLVDLQDVVLVAGVGADDIPRLHVVLGILAEDPRLAPEHEPVLVEVVVMA